MRVFFFVDMETETGCVREPYLHHVLSVYMHKMYISTLWKESERFDVAYSKEWQREGKKNYQEKKCVRTRMKNRLSNHFLCSFHSDTTHCSYVSRRRTRRNNSNDNLGWKIRTTATIVGRMEEGEKVFLHYNFSNAFCMRGKKCKKWISRESCRLRRRKDISTVRNAIAIELSARCSSPWCRREEAKKKTAFCNAGRYNLPSSTSRFFCIFPFPSSSSSDEKESYSAKESERKKCNIVHKKMCLRVFPLFSREKASLQLPTHEACWHKKYREGLLAVSIIDEGNGWE